MVIEVDFSYVDFVVGVVVDLSLDELKDIVRVVVFIEFDLVDIIV